jgi:hypothetical protein
MNARPASRKREAEADLMFLPLEILPDLLVERVVSFQRLKRFSLEDS